MSTQSKIVVFDLDETMGYFAEFGMFWDAINSYVKKINSGIKNDQGGIKIDQALFNNLLHLYPEFIRPNILNILSYLKKQKKSLNCNKIIIYTNNQAIKQWSLMIKTFFENKLSYKLFDHLIGAFKINGKQIELCRTTHLKTYKDLVHCIKLPEKTKICFLDDAFYPDMAHKDVYYINIKPYIHNLPFETLVNRLLQSSIISKEWGLPTQIHEYLMNYLKQCHYTYVEKTKREIIVDKVVSKKILQHLHVFFGKSDSHIHPNKTKHNRQIQIKHKTLKNRKINVTINDDTNTNT